MKLPIPDDWIEERDGYVLALVCVPNSLQWRAIARGRFADLTGGRIWDEKTGRIKAVQVIAREIFDSMAMCKLDELLIQFKRLNAILAGEELTVIQDGVTSHWDYTETGLVPTLEDMSPVATVNKLEDLRVMLETRMTAETTAANTRSYNEQQILSDIADAVEVLDQEFNTALIAKIEELRAMLETRMTAETTAGNTRNTRLIEAVKEIDASTTVNLNNGNGCCDCGECADCTGGNTFTATVQE